MGGRGTLPGKGLCRCHLLTSCSSFCYLLMHQYFFEIVLGCFSPHYHSNVYFMRLQQRQVIPIRHRGGAAPQARSQGEGQEAAPSCPTDLPLSPVVSIGTSPTRCLLPSPLLPPAALFLSLLLLLLPVWSSPKGKSPGLGTLQAAAGSLRISGAHPGKAQEGCEGRSGYESWLLSGEDPP